MAPGLRVDLGPLGPVTVRRDGAVVRVLTVGGDPAPAAVELAALAILAGRYLDDLPPPPPSLDDWARFSRAH